MLDIANIVSSVASQLSDHPDLVDFQVERGEYINTDPSRTPWVGVYRNGFTIDPKTIGSNRNWVAIVKIEIYVQAHDNTGGSYAEDALGDSLDKVLTVLKSDLTFGGAVDTTKSLDVSFSYQPTESETLDYQWAIITMELEVRV